MDLRGDVSLSTQQIAAMEHGLGVMAVGDASVLVTDRFVHEVRQLTGQSSYSDDRGTGTVGGKTVATQRGPLIVVNYSAAKAMSELELERLLAHEAGHVLLERRGERVSDHHDLANTQWRYDLLAMQAHALEEVRIERHLADLGYEPSIDEEHLGYSLFVSNAELISALLDPASADPHHLQDAVMTTVGRLTTTLAYFAAPLVSSSKEPALRGPTTYVAGNWADYVAPTWTQRLALYRDVPPVSARMPTTEWRAALRQCVNLQEAFLRNVGFFYTESEGGTGFFRVQDERMWNVRLERARREGAQREVE